MIDRRMVRIACRLFERTEALTGLRRQYGDTPELLSLCRRVWARMEAGAGPFRMSRAFQRRHFRRWTPEQLRTRWPWHRIE